MVRALLSGLLAFSSFIPAATGEPFWAFKKAARPPLPRVEQAEWVRNPIDLFILQALERKGLTPSPPAPKSDLIRRASFDLLGLPPAPEEVDAFLADDAPDAFNKVVDRLLASPHHGERWGRHWLDLARYAESEGFKSDETRPNAWRYRDYVIRSFNADKPYDRFVAEQIAGDELWPGDPDALVATGFNRHYPDESNARDLFQRRQEILNDITDTVGAVFTGLTVGCARCHDHKFDPITQADYYRLQAFFANVRAADDIILAPPAAVREHQETLVAWEGKTAGIRKEMEALEEPARKSIVQDLIDKYPADIKAAILKRPEERTPAEWLMFYKARPYLKPSSRDVAAVLKGEEKKQYQALEKELKSFAPLLPAELPVGIGIADASGTAPATFVLAGGVHTAPREAVESGFYSVLDPRPPAITPPPAVSSTGRRSALARWLTDAGNPLTARVMVNRLWYYHFGRGLVATPSDFGLMGEPPSHPELLDWLAREFIARGWSLKAVHRLIMTSSAYRQASLHRDDAARADPDDRLLWRFPRRRLEAEAIRDGALTVAGLLNHRMGGPSVFPPLPPGMESRGGWEATPDPAAHNRRSVYIFVRRNTRYPLLEVFDLPDTHESCARRNLTTTAPQALALLNNDLVLDWARSFAGRVLNEAGAQCSREAQAALAFRLAYSRLPDEREKEIAREFFERQSALLRERDRAGEKLALPISYPAPMGPADAAALVDFCHVLLNSNEFVYRN